MRRRGDGLIDPTHQQREYAVRLEWGPAGAEALVAAGDVDVVVVVDVLSFSTTVTVAVERGITVHPFGWRDERAEAYAAEVGAVLAVGRLEQGRLERNGGVSLSPAAMSRVRGVQRIVLPSPNGSAISRLLVGRPGLTVAGCLRNASAVARAVAGALSGLGRVLVVPAGERWSTDGSLRPCAEDLWGAGAVVAALADLGVGGLSPEARVAEAAFRSVRDDLAAQLAECAGGRELAGKGFADDVRVAAELDASEVVPTLVDGAYVAV